VTPKAVTVFGAIALDSRLTALLPLVGGTSNPVKGREAPGGVGRNVAVAMARLGCRVSLASRVGQDAAGTALLTELDGEGIDTQEVGRSCKAPTARYWAVLEPTGELALGLADMAVLDELEPAELEPAMTLPAVAWFIDANLAEAAIEHLLDHPARPALVAVDTVSTAKARRLKGKLAKVDLLFTNTAEAEVLAGDAEPQRLLAQGAKAVVIGAGAAGLVVADAGGVSRLAALAIQKVDVTGAGDALAAATLAARLAGLELKAAARIGRLAAAAVLEGSTFPDIAGLREQATRHDSATHAELARL
jgi:pseudouridine kinase